MIYNLRVGEKDNRSYLKISVEYKEPEETDSEKGDDEREQPGTSLKVAETAHEQHELFSHWIYEISSFRKDEFVKKLSDTVE